MEKKKMGLGKKIGIGIGIFFAIFVAFGIIGSIYFNSSETPELVETSESSEQQPSTEKSALELLPKRADLSTEWQFSSNGTSENINATGFDSGSLLRLRKGSGYDVTSVTANVYKFDSIENAKNYYQFLVESQKEKGGYDESSTFGIWADCYAWHQGTLSADWGFIYCTKNDIVIYISGRNPYGAVDAVKEVAKIIISKI